MGMDKSLKPGFQTEELKYISSRNHVLMGVGYPNANLRNIGNKGSNLTIAVLSMNRSSLTIRLMESIKNVIPDFAGEFLIGDNGSEESEKDKIKEKMKQMPYRCRMIEFDKNYGVAGGRNRINKHVESDWIFQLDNDVYFIGNPLPKIQKDIAKLGCHFMSVPILNKENHGVFLYGGHLYIEALNNGISIGGGSAYISASIEPNNEYEPFLCTFLSGGVSVINKNTFFSCGGYDEGMFIGFEDTEFSLRLFQSGYKIGACGIACIIHDHPQPEIKIDADYERQRFSNSKLYESAKYFEKKHGFKVWNPMVESWLSDQLKNLLGESAEPNKESVKVVKYKKPNILLVVDYPHWALYNIAQQIIQNCSDTYSFKLLCLSDIDNLNAVFLAAHDCELIHFFWRSWLSDANDDYTKGYANRFGMRSEDFDRLYVDNKIVTTSVYDHLYLEDGFDITKKLFIDENSIVKGYTVSSEILKNIYDKDERIKIKPKMVITDGVDLHLFKPSRLERFNNIQKGDKLVIGWAGNSKWAHEKEDFKGLHTILRPAVEELQAEGYPVELEICDSSVNKIPHSEMPKYYEKIDLYVCVSKIEGTPNPILECMACGVPFISTKVGIVPEVAGEVQKLYILQERSISCLKNKLIEILDNPGILKILSDENLNSIKYWDWKDRARKFIDFWNSYLIQK